MSMECPVVESALPSPTQPSPMCATTLRADIFQTLSPMLVLAVPRYLHQKSRCRTMPASVKLLCNKTLLTLCLFFQGTFSSPEEFIKFVVRNDGGVPTCGICLQFSNQAIVNVRNHIESKHYPNTFTYSCPKCHSLKNTKKALEIHVRKCQTWEREINGDGWVRNFGSIVPIFFVSFLLLFFWGLWVLMSL